MCLIYVAYWALKTYLTYKALLIVVVSWSIMIGL